MTDNQPKKKNRLPVWIVTPVLLGWLIYSFVDFIHDYRERHPTPMSDSEFREACITADIKESRILSLTDSMTARRIDGIMVDLAIKKFGRTRYAEMSELIKTDKADSIVALVQPIIDSVYNVYTSELRRGIILNDWINALMQKGKWAEKNVTDYSICFYDYLTSKYGSHIDSTGFDTLVRVEMTKNRECMKAAGLIK